MVVPKPWSFLHTTKHAKHGPRDTFPVGKGIDLQDIVLRERKLEPAEHIVIDRSGNDPTEKSGDEPADCCAAWAAAEYSQTVLPRGRPCYVGGSLKEEAHAVIDATRIHQH